MQALAEAYNTYTEIDRASDLERLIDLARYTAETWPDREQGDDARLNLGQIYQGRGQYDQAIAAVRGGPRPVAQVDRGPDPARRRPLGQEPDARAPRRQGQGRPPRPRRRIELLDRTLKARQSGGATPTDPGLVGNAGDLAVALTETGKAAEALKLLDPIVKAQTDKTGVSLYPTDGGAAAGPHQHQPGRAGDRHHEDARAAGRAPACTQLYFKLGKLLERELERLKARRTTPALTRMQQSYQTFLTALTESKSGQTYESLEWAGESLLSLGRLQGGRDGLPQRPQRVHHEPEVPPPGRRPMSGSCGPSSGWRPPSAAREPMTSRSSTKPLARRGAARQVSSAISSRWSRRACCWKPRPRPTGGMVGGRSRHWQELAAKLSRIRPRPLAYYDAWYHAAYALSQQNQTKKARQTLNGVMRLNPDVGSPEMKAKYEQFLER